LEIKKSDFCQHRKLPLGNIGVDEINFLSLLKIGKEKTDNKIFEDRFFSIDKTGSQQKQSYIG